MLKRRMIPLTALRAFEACARHQSFSKAAEELMVTTSAVSRQISSLEDFVGTPLFHRRVRQVEITRAGRELQVTTARSFDDISQGLEHIIERARSEGRQGQQVLEVRVLTAFARFLLMPHIQEFHEEFPGAEVPLTIAGMGFYANQKHIGKGIGAAQPDVDIAYSMDRPEIKREILFQEKAIVVASPAFIVKHGIDAPMTPHDLARVPLISSSEESRDWNAWFEFAGAKPPLMPAETNVPTDDLAITGALAGRGAALVEMRFVADELSDGRLVSLCRIRPLALGYYVARVHDQADEHLAAQFQRWMTNIAVDSFEQAQEAMAA